MWVRAAWFPNKYIGRVKGKRHFGNFGVETLNKTIDILLYKYASIFQRQVLRKYYSPAFNSK